MRRFREGIEKSPIEAYRSALFFSPEQSIIRNLFVDKEPAGLEVVATIKSEWGSCLQSLEAQSKAALPIAFSSHGSMLASAFNKRFIALWRADTGAYIRYLQGHSTDITSLTYAKDGITIVSGSAGGSIRLWNAVQGHCKGLLMGHSAAVLVVALDEQGEVLVSGSQDRTIKFWDTMTGACRQTIEDVEGGKLTVSSNRQIFAFPLAAGEIELWDAKTVTRIKTLRRNTGEVQVMALSSNAEKVACASYEHLMVWDLKDRPLQFRRKVNKQISAMVFSADDTRLATNWGAHGIKLWNSKAHGLKILQTYGGPFHSLLFTPDCTMLSSSATDGTVKLWNLENDSGHQDTSAAISTSSSEDVTLCSELSNRDESPERHISLWRLMLPFSSIQPQTCKYCMKSLKLTDPVSYDANII